jgi:hypothetical protein
MSEHARIDSNGNVSEIVDLDPSLRAAWIASGNPKAATYLPVSVDPIPSYNPKTSTVDAYYSIAPGVAVTRAWFVRPLTADELRKTWSPLDFLARFSSSELDAIETARLSNSMVRDFYRSALAAQEIVSDDPRTIDGMNLLVALGLLTTARADEILGN